MPERLKQWLKVKNAPDIGYQTALRLFDSYGKPESWSLDTLHDALQQKYISDTAFNILAANTEPYDWNRICKYLESFEIKYSTVLDADYPALLKTIYAPPLILFYRGNLSNALSDWSLGVVGTRKPTEYGKTMTEAIVGPLAKAGVTIVSGMAYGIDTVSHKATLKANGKTIAVMAHGLEQIYPPQNRELAEQIISTGAMVSEYEPGSKVERWNFPARNRIIAGLSHGVLVSEGQMSSGSLLTAKFALDQNRDVYAIPGQINIPNAAGPNHLIKNGAKLVTTAEDILLDFGMDLKPPEQIELFPELSENEQIIYDYFKTEQKDFSFDELIFRSSFSIGQLSIILLNLELKGLLMKTHGSAYQMK
jgi:DNA processing protein